MLTSIALALTLGGTVIQTDNERDAMIERAMAATRAAISKAEADPNRPAFHFTAPAQWMNDPNGPIFYHGWYHLFYQAHPFGDQGGPKYWGHARSRDLVGWEQLPIAIWPSQSRGENEIWSGSCFPVRGRPTAFYTSIGNLPPEQWAAVPEDNDLIRWQKLPREPVLTSDLQEWRDPFLFSDHGRDYLITGGGKDGRGIVALYRATDPTLQHWEFQHILFHHPDADVRNIECPNFARVGSKWVLLVSVHGRVESFVGDLDDAMNFQVSRRGVLDEGSYASQLLTDPHGRVIHWAWVPTDDHQGWNGFLTLPSTLSVSASGDLNWQPVKELTRLRDEREEFHDLKVDGEHVLNCTGDLLEVVAKVDFRGAKEFGIKLRRSPDGARASSVTYPAQAGELNVHLFLDRGVVDDYNGAGRTIRFSARPEDLGMSLFTSGGAATVRSLEVYHLRPARFDLSHFH